MDTKITTALPVLISSGHAGGRAESWDGMGQKVNGEGGKCGEIVVNDGKSPFLMGKSSVNAK